MKTSNQCQHGQLARSCPLCAPLEEIDEWARENAQLRAAVNDAIRAPMGVVPASAAAYYRAQGTDYER